MRKNAVTEHGASEKFAGSLDEIAREGVRRMLLSVLEAEVESFLGCRRYQRTEEFNGYRNGYGKQRRAHGGIAEVGALESPDRFDNYSVCMRQ